MSAELENHVPVAENGVLAVSIDMYEYFRNSIQVYFLSIIFNLIGGKTLHLTHFLSRLLFQPFE
jgi:hypothetical protein